MAGQAIFAWNRPNLFNAHGAFHQELISQRRLFEPRRGSLMMKIV
jgi:hypothetical protein